MINNVYIKYFKVFWNYLNIILKYYIFWKKSLLINRFCMLYSLMIIKKVVGKLCFGKKLVYVFS